jgi:hypothetical protein
MRRCPRCRTTASKRQRTSRDQVPSSNWGAVPPAGIDVAFESLIQGDGSVGGAASGVSVKIESMRARDVDAVFVVGDAIVATNAFIGEDFLPTMFIADQGSAGGAATRAELSVFSEPVHVRWIN